ncbi:MAG: hypothetical protein NXI04_18360 [Planctomycetaceae bacterium]|nr:hypothetical protein [Planctomycetaceae bacterium]
MTGQIAKPRLVTPPGARIFGRLLLMLILCGTASGQSTTVRQISEQPDLLQEWAKSGRAVTITGCYEGRFSRQFRLLKLPVTLKPGRSVVLPADVSSGQRIVVTGTIRQAGARFEMAVERIAVGASDADRVRAAKRRLPADRPGAGFDLAKQYQEISDFYGDEELEAELRLLREDSFAAARVQWKDSFDDLNRLARIAESLKLDDRQTQAVRFEAVVALRKDPQATPQQQLTAVKELRGWDVSNAFADAARERAFLADPVREYNKATAENRRRMHRRIYRLVRLPLLEGRLKEDGSNGDVVAAVIGQELPEETRAIAKMQSRYVDYRLQRIPLLGQSGMTSLVDLLNSTGRKQQVRPTVDAWLQAQQQRLDVSKLEEQIALADAFLFAADRWDLPGHEDKGVEMLKTAWVKVRDVAPDEAARIYDRLRRFGWQRVGDRWLTKEQMARLPQNDPALALLERRVVKGMKASEVATIVGGDPSRIIRVASAQSVHEIWVFGERGSESLIVHVTRMRFNDSDEGQVTFVGKP